METKEKPLHTLASIEDFKALMGVDDREDRHARFCLVTATLNIEHYCRRKFLRNQYFETVKIGNDLVLPLREYPVSEILAVFTLTSQQFSEGTGKILEPEFYRPMIGCDYNEDLPFELLLSPSLIPYQLTAVKINYLAGFEIIPEDLSAACMELAIWNMNRYRGRRVGMTGNLKGAGLHAEHFELTMPENVRDLIEPYRRKTI